MKCDISPGNMVFKVCFWVLFHKETEPVGPVSVSILEALKTPKASDLTRKRKVDCNPPPKGKRKARGEGSSEQKTVSPRERVREFPDECLTVTGKGARKLFCIF